jgi:hypothetical protein
MSDLIYQYWDGEIKESCRAGVNAMKRYADTIGAEYIFEENPNFLRKHFGYNFGGYSPHYGAFKPIWDESFDKYDKIMFVDTDVFPKEGLTTNVFDEFTGQIGICREPEESRIRTITAGRITHESDERWASLIKNVFVTDVPRDDYGVVVYNTGMVLYSKEARLKARNTFTDPKRYVEMVRNMGLDSFYTCDQPYLHGQMFAQKFDVQEMDTCWNSILTYSRLKGLKDRVFKNYTDDNTKFVHVQFRGADNLDEETHLKIVNLPQEQWGIEI